LSINAISPHFRASVVATACCAQLKAIDRSDCRRARPPAIVTRPFDVDFVGMASRSAMRAACVAPREKIGPRRLQ
jgi:hypothetical protein